MARATLESTLFAACHEAPINSVLRDLLVAHLLDVCFLSNHGSTAVPEELKNLRVLEVTDKTVSAGVLSVLCFVRF